MKIGLHAHLTPGVEERYEEYHRAAWPEVLDGIFRDGLDTSSPAN
jgi:L-rhamnose mutarotase